MKQNKNKKITCTIMVVKWEPSDEELHMVCQVNNNNNAKQHQSLQQVLNNINKFF